MPKPRKVKPKETDEWSSTIVFTSAPDTPATMISYATRDDSGRVVDKGVFTVWPAWDERRDLCVILVSRLSHEASEQYELLRYEVSGRREELDLEKFAHGLVRRRAAFLRALRDGYIPEIANVRNVGEPILPSLENPR